MELHTENDGNVLIVKPSGRIDGSNAFDFQNAIDEVVGEEQSAIVMDLSDLSYISSAGLRVILLLAKKLRGRQAELMLCALGDSIKDVFEISGFGKIIPIRGSRSEAVSELSG